MDTLSQVASIVQADSAHSGDHSHVDPKLLLKEYDTHHIHTDISLQAKNKETCYIPLDWVMSKLDQIKATSSLSVNTSVLADSIKINKNILSMNIKTYMDRNATMELHFFEDGVIKFNCINPANPSKFSLELLDKPANLTPYLLEERVILDNNQIEVIMVEAQAKVIVKFDPFTVTLFSTQSDAQEVLLEMNSNSSLKFDDNLAADFTFATEYLYGLPERPVNLLLEDTKEELPYRFYNQDIPGYPINSKNSIYGSVPVIVSRSKNSSTMVSMFWQNASDTYIDIHKSDSSSKTFWLSERGNLECYVFVSHDTKTHFRGFSNVFGHCAMPQYFTLGYHQCRWSYEDQRDVLEVNQKFNEHEIPCDSITIDIDHTDGCKYFTWNEELYPDVIGMQQQLVSDGREVITIQDPHIKVDEEYHVYKEAAEQELYIKTKDNEPFIGKCWPGPSIYLDFLNEDTRDCWASQYSYEKYKLSTPNIWAWNDMNEPSVFEIPGNHMPVENLQTFKSKDHPDNVFQVEHREVHNLYGYTQVKATYDGMLKRNKDQNIRPHVLTRSFYAGTQKYTVVWTGDTQTTWEMLRFTVPQLLSLALCGLSNAGSDIGGFIGNPEPELAVRWYQLGIFMPFFRGHSDKNSKRREPWLYEKKYLDHIKESIKERYRLLPYIYTAFEDHCRTAVPLWRPIWFDQERVLKEANMHEQQRFMLGDSLLVVPIVEKGVTTIKGVLEGLGGRWYDYFSNKEIFGNEEISIGLERIGCFIKGGSIVPTFDIRSYVKSSKEARQRGIQLHVALDDSESAKGSVYYDDGETFNYKKGECLRCSMEFNKDTLVWNREESSFGSSVKNKVSKVIVSGLRNKCQSAYLVEDGEKKQKVQLTKESGFFMVELAAPLNKNWKIVFE